MKRSINVRYTVSREPEHERFPWIVTDSHGNPALWRDDPKVGETVDALSHRGIRAAAADR
jgi:hypothetical protein